MEEHERDERMERVEHKLNRLIDMVHRLNQKENQIMSNQADEDAAVARVETDVSALNTAVPKLQSGIDALNAEIANLQGQGVDVTGLQNAANDLDAATTAVAAVNTAPPTPTPAPGPAPAPAPNPGP